MSVYGPDIVMVKERVGLRQEERRATLSAERVLGGDRAELLVGLSAKLQLNFAAARCKKPFCLHLDSLRRAEGPEIGIEDFLRSHTCTFSFCHHHISFRTFFATGTRLRSSHIQSYTITMALSEDTKERIIKAVDVSKTLLHYGWVPFVLYIGFTRSTPQPSLINVSRLPVHQDPSKNELFLQRYKQPPPRSLLSIIQAPTSPRLDFHPTMNPNRRYGGISSHAKGGVRQPQRPAIPTSSTVGSFYSANEPSRTSSTVGPPVLTPRPSSQHLPTPRQGPSAPSTAAALEPFGQPFDATNRHESAAEDYDTSVHALLPPSSNLTRPPGTGTLRSSNSDQYQRLKRGRSRTAGDCYDSPLPASQRSASAQHTGGHDPTATHLRATLRETQEHQTRIEDRQERNEHKLDYLMECNEELVAALKKVASAQSDYNAGFQVQRQWHEALRRDIEQLQERVAVQLNGAMNEIHEIAEATQHLSAMRDDLNSIATTVAGFEQSAENRHQAIHMGQAELLDIVQHLKSSIDVQLQRMRDSFERFANVVAAERQQARSHQQDYARSRDEQRQQMQDLRDMLVMILTAMGAQPPPARIGISQASPTSPFRRVLVPLTPDVVPDETAAFSTELSPAPIDPNMDMRQSTRSRKVGTQCRDDNDAENQDPSASPAARGAARGGTRKTARAPQRYEGQAKKTARQPSVEEEVVEEEEQGKEEEEEAPEQQPEPRGTKRTFPLAMGSVDSDDGRIDITLAPSPDPPEPVSPQKRGRSTTAKAPPKNSRGKMATAKTPAKGSGGKTGGVNPRQRATAKGKAKGKAVATGSQQEAVESQIAEPSPYRRHTRSRGHANLLPGVLR